MEYRDIPKFFSVFNYCSLKKRKKMSTVDSLGWALKNDIYGTDYLHPGVKDMI